MSPMSLVRMTSVLVTAIILVTSPDVARSQKNAVRRFTVRGTVTDYKGSPVAFGMVCLKETHGQSLKIKRADRDGRFIFTWLDARFDYEIYAQQEDLISEKVVFSGSQQKPEAVINLKIK